MSGKLVFQRGSAERVQPGPSWSQFSPLFKTSPLAFAHLPQFPLQTPSSHLLCIDTVEAGVVVKGEQEALSPNGSSTVVSKKDQGKYKTHLETLLQGHPIVDRNVYRQQDWCFVGCHKCFAYGRTPLLMLLVIGCRGENYCYISNFAWSVFSPHGKFSSLVALLAEAART